MIGKVVRLYAIWLLALGAGVYGTALVYRGLFSGERFELIYGVPILLLGVWVTGNIWASARQVYRRQRAQKAS